MALYSTSRMPWPFLRVVEMNFGILSIAPSSLPIFARLSSCLSGMIVLAYNALKLMEFARFVAVDFVHDRDKQRHASNARQYPLLGAALVIQDMFPLPSC